MAAICLTSARSAGVNRPVSTQPSDPISPTVLSMSSAVSVSPMSTPGRSSWNSWYRAA